MSNKNRKLSIGIACLVFICVASSIAILFARLGRTFSKKRQSEVLSINIDTDSIAPSENPRSSPSPFALNIKTSTPSVAPTLALWIRIGSETPSALPNADTMIPSNHVDDTSNHESNPPSASVTLSPTRTISSTFRPTAEKTPAPSLKLPQELPSGEPSLFPTVNTVEPLLPSGAPSLLSAVNTAEPSSEPIRTLSEDPTKEPSWSPSTHPVTLTSNPTEKTPYPSSIPDPAILPYSTFSPSQHLSRRPSQNPSQDPTWSPTGTVVTSTSSPTIETHTQSSSPTVFPTTHPTSPPSKHSLTTSTPTEKEDTGGLFTRFYAIGDVPYTNSEKTELELQIKSLPDDAEFLIHVGDIRSARDGRDCELEEYAEVADILLQSHVPVFIVLGDNEWNDCPNVNQGFRRWNSVFGNFELHWDHPFQVIRPSDRSESFAFVHKGALFIGLNLVAGRVHHAGEWSSRLEVQFQWVRQLVTTYALGPNAAAKSITIFGHANPTSDHAGFFDPLSSYIQEELRNSIPFLYVNGDAHRWRYQTNFFDQSSFLRIQVEGGTREPPLQVSINSTVITSPISRIFSFDRMLA